VTTNDFDDAPALVFRRATVVTVDDAGVIDGGDVLVVGDRIAAVGHALTVPDGTRSCIRTGTSSTRPAAATCTRCS